MRVLSSLASVAVSVATSDAAAVSAGDLRRARTKVPGTSLRGSSFARANHKLNRALERGGAAPILAACSELSVPELQETLEVLIKTRNLELSSIYELTEDARALRHTTLAGYEAEWVSTARLALSSELANAAHDMLCHEAVMLYVHHLSSQQQVSLASQGAIRLPMLPAGERLFATGTADLGSDERLVAEAYLKATGCAACHTDQDDVEPDTPVGPDAPKWPPLAEPVLPWRFSADLNGWMDMSGARTNFSGSFHYDYALNRLKEHWVVESMGMEIINYWFGAPGPDWEEAKDLPEGATRGHIYQVMRMGGQVISCRDDKYPTFSIVRPDAFVKQWRNDPKNLHYVARENMALEDMGGATGWADHWTYADSCGNFSLWMSLETGLPVYTRGPTGCNSGDAGNSYLNHTLSAPADALFQFNFSTCSPPNRSAESGHAVPWSSPLDAMMQAAVI